MKYSGCLFRCFIPLVIVCFIFSSSHAQTETGDKEGFKGRRIPPRNKKSIIIGLRAGLMFNKFREEGRDRLFDSYKEARTDLINSFSNVQGTFPGGYMDIRLTLSGGVYMSTFLAKGIAFQGELLYSPKGYLLDAFIGIEEPGVRNVIKYVEKYKLDYLEFPLSIKFFVSSWRVSPYLCLGVTPAIRINSYKETELNLIQGSQQFRNALISHDFPVESSKTRINSSLLDLGLSGALGIHWHRKKNYRIIYSFDVKINHGLVGTPIDLQRGGKTHVNYFNELYSFGFAYLVE